MNHSFRTLSQDEYFLQCYLRMFMFLTMSLYNDYTFKEPVSLMLLLLSGLHREHVRLVMTAERWSVV